MGVMYDIRIAVLESAILECMTQIRTHLTVTVHELAAVRSPSAHNVLRRIERGQLPFVWRLSDPGIIYDNLGVARACSSGDGGEGS